MKRRESGTDLLHRRHRRVHAQRQEIGIEVVEAAREEIGVDGASLKPLLRRSTEV
jgi:hypothetical protein